MTITAAVSLGADEPSEGRSNSGHRRARAGFTLLELMVALLLLSLIFLLLTSGLNFGTKVWSERSTERSGGSETLITQSVLRRLISETRPVMIEYTGTHARHVVFAGDTTSMRFVTTMPDHLGVGGLYDLTISLVPGGAAGRVDLDWSLFRTADASAKAGDERHASLLSDVEKLEFSYFGRLGVEPQAQWHATWRDVDRLPDLIRMRILFSDNARVWPDLVVAPIVHSLTMVIDPDRDK